jgi:Flp pilus assembly protein TadG
MPSPLATVLNRTARRAERGSFVLIVAILAVLVFGFVGLAVDAGHVGATAGQLQDAADAAALAATASLVAEAQTGGSQGTFAITRQKAIDVAAANYAAGATVQLKPNYANQDNGDVVVGRWTSSTKTFVPTIIAPNAVKIVAKRTADSLGGALPLMFGGPFQATMSDVARSSIAVYKSSQNPLIHVLRPNANNTFDMGGSPVLNVSDGSVQVNSSDSCAMHGNGTGLLMAASVDVVGGACVPTTMVQGPLNTGAASIPDPLADILPTVSDWNALKNSMPKPLGAKGQIANSGTFSPGYYPKGLSINNSTVVTLLPGSYMFGSDVTLQGQALLTGNGVTIFADNGVPVRVLGGASVTLSPPASGDFQGLVLMCHRQTTDSKACSIGGNGSLSFQGSLYVPAGGMDLTGTGLAQAFGQLVCWTLEVSGTSDITGINIVPAQSTAKVLLVN